MNDALLSYFGGDELAANVWFNKYALKDDDGNVIEQTPDDMHRRLAKKFYEAEMLNMNKEAANMQWKDNVQPLSKYGRERKPLTEEDIYQLFKGFKYIIPQGSIMQMLGNNAKIGSLSNCFVIGQPVDSYGGIMLKDQEQVQLMKRRGGVGMDLSSLRPRHTKVNNAALTSSGAASFMHRFSNSTREVAQDGRRGALMLTLNVRHPDIFEFVDTKLDTTKVTGANVSVMIHDDFMETVKNDGDYILHYPVDAKINISTDDMIHDALYQGENGMLAIKIKARKLWDRIISAAHKSAEPGIMFIDNHWNYSPDGVYPRFKGISTNPCFVKGSRVDVITNHGIKNIEQITSDDLIWLDDKKVFVPNSGYFDTGVNESFEVIFTNGEVIQITNYHKLAKVVNKRIGSKLDKSEFILTPLNELTIGSEIKLHTNEVPDEVFGNLGNKEEGLILGWLSGDGCLSFDNKRQNHPTMYLDFWKNDHELIPLFKQAISSLGLQQNGTIQKNNGNEVHRFSSIQLSQYFTEKYEMNIWKWRKGRNDILYKFNKEFIKGYLSAYFTADGTVKSVDVSSRFLISLCSIDKEKLYQVKQLLNCFGITCSIGINKLEGDGGYANSKTSYRLSITGITNIRKFYNEIGFLTDAKNLILKSIVEREFSYEKSLGYTKIKSITPIGMKETGCLTVFNHNYLSVNGLISGQCGEIFMGEYDACRLIAINLLSFVEFPYTERAFFNFGKFYEVAYEQQRLADDLVDLEIEAINKIIEHIDRSKESIEIKAVERNLWLRIKETAKAGRRTGSGFTALGDVFAAMNIEYGSEKGQGLLEYIMRTKFTAELDCTTDLAILRGTFEGCDPEMEFGVDMSNPANPFYARLMQDFPEQAKRMYIYGRRNISWSTLAPTGSVSILTQTTSGIEPVFQIAFKRRKKINANDSNVRVDFVDDLGDKFQEFNVIHPQLQKWYDIKNPKNPVDLTKVPFDLLEKLIQESPWYGNTSDTINVENRIKTQAIVQKYTTHSISSTINLSKDTTVETIGKIYMMAKEHNLKGITVYRDGSRSGILVNTQDAPKNFVVQHAVKRPAILNSRLHFATVKGKNHVVVIGLLENKPYEIFSFTDEKRMNKVINGKTIKVKKGVYMFKSDDGEFIVENLVHESDVEEQASTLYVSQLLRHGTPITHVIKTMKKVSTNVSSFTAAVIRVLSLYVPNGTQSAETCHICGSKLTYENGCSICKECGQGGSC